MHQTLQVVASSRNGKKNGEAAVAEELYPTALCFRLMRLHGYKMLSMASWMRRVICKLAKRNALQSKTNTGKFEGASY
ncbi:hypothetical protein COLO4_32806 [Corchorus olitorius]|uniref:Uncharacterized protein n=1 Tax=Corchorus olitorius TaxID=93759 RepID=A0A1R3GXU2_9ROSI|nr:hypothetical protein COLO4_32806 [Corchorus olitorius]